MGSHHLLRRLCSAIDRDDIADVEDLINEGANPQKESGDHGPLVRCINRDRLEIAKFLIEVGSNTTEIHCGKTPLIYAISRENLDMVKLLLDNGADFTMYEALIPAIDTNNLEIVRELTARGVDVHRSDGRGRGEFPIMRAIRNGNCDILKFLVENGANVNVVDGNGDTPLTKSIRLKNAPIVEYLITCKADLTTKSSSEQFELPIMYAIRFGNMDIVKLLMKHGADINARSNTGDTALMTSVRCMNVPMTQFLIELKTDLDMENAANERPLSLALAKHDFRTFKLLIEAGADPKLASEAIEAKATEYPDLAAYMTKVNATKSVNHQQLEASVGHEAALESDSP